MKAPFFLSKNKFGRIIEINEPLRYCDAKLRFMSDKETENKKSEEFNIKELYTPLFVAEKEIRRRWNDKNLRRKVEKYLGGEMPGPFKKEPRAVLSRSIITPNRELFYFLDLAQNTNLRPIGLEGIEDKFCTKNYDKVSFGKLSFYEDRRGSRTKKMEDGKSIVRVINMMDADGKKICDVSTLWGEKLTDFHHRMLNLYGVKIETFDDFKWFSKKSKRSNPYQYYENFFAFFVCHGILFENFYAKGKEESFTNNIIIENYKKISNIFQLKPLIVPLVPIEDEECLDYWNGYLIKLGEKDTAEK